MEVFNSPVVHALLWVVVTGVGWWVNNMWQMIQSQQRQLTELNVKLAENYVPRVELQSSLNRIFDMLEEIRKNQK
jgi:hypothetical protein